jgi:hypothetical protein
VTRRNPFVTGCASKGVPDRLQDPDTSKKNGAPGGTRTPDPQVRSLMLYPAELPARGARGRRKRNGSGRGPHWAAIGHDPLPVGPRARAPREAWTWLPQGRRAGGGPRRRSGSARDGLALPEVQREDDAIERCVITSARRALPRGDPPALLRRGLSPRLLHAPRRGANGARAARAASRSPRAWLHRSRLHQSEGGTS